MGPDRDVTAGLPRSLVVALFVLGAVLFATVVPGVFTIDEDNYLVNAIAMRQGHVTVANTAGLTPSRELVFFDPAPRSRVVTSTPVGSNAPPLYGLLAAPFSWFGWRGLVALNLLAYLGTTILVFVYAGRYATRAATPWLAAGAFALGGFMIEYAQGLWPHALSVALCTGGILAAGTVLEGGRLRMAATAGFLLALAAGVRYQNAVVLVAVGGGIALWGAHRWRSILAFGLAASAPLAASAAINFGRLGSWNPISKGPMYLNVPLLRDPATSVWDPLVLAWARVIDFSVRPPLVGPWFRFVQYDPATGAHLMVGEVIQKSILQSAPWAILGLLLFVSVWLPGLAPSDARRRQIRLLSLVTIAVVATFAFAGVLRNEGLSFNQRYHLELLPLLAVGFAWALDSFAWRERPFWGGVLCGLAAVVLLLLGMPLGTYRILLLLKVPVLLAAVLAGLWLLAVRGRARPFLAGVAGICLGWGLALHLGDDVATSRMFRKGNYRTAEALRAAMPDHSALIAHWGRKDAAGALLFNRDVVILDAWADDGADAPTLIRELLARGRRVFVIRAGFPPKMLSRVVEGWTVVPLPGSGLLELRAARNDAPAR